MDAKDRIVLAFVERLLLNQTGQDYDSWSLEHLEDVAQALEKVDQPGAAGLLRKQWQEFQSFREKRAKQCTCGAGAVSQCPSHGSRPAVPTPAHDSGR